MFPLNLFRSNPYQSLTTLRGQRDAITSLTFSVFGQFVAAAGPSGVVIWDIETLQVVPLTLTPDNIHDPLKNAFPAACWIYFAQQNRHVLLLGSFASTIQLWDYIDAKLRFECKRKPVPHLTAAAEAAPQVLAVNCFPREVPVGKKAQIVVSFGDSSLGVWTLEADGELKQNFVVALEAELFPKVVRFDLDGNILVFSWKGRNVTLLHGGSGNTLWRKTTAPNLMGAVAVNETYEHFVACTSDGFELFNLEQMNLVRKLEHQPALLALPKQVSFVGQHILGRTDRGCAEVYALKSGKVVQSLKYPQGGLVQSVATCVSGERYLLAIAGSNGNQPCDVILWYRPRPTASPVSKEYCTLSLGSVTFKRKYLKLVGWFLLVIVLLAGYTAVVLHYSDIIYGHACHAPFNLCSLRSNAEAPAHKPNLPKTMPVIELPGCEVIRRDIIFIDDKGKSGKKEHHGKRKQERRRSH